MIEDDVRRLLDHQEITEVQHRLCALVDSFELERMVQEVFAENGSDDHGGGPVVGRQAILEWYRDSTRNVAAIAHNVTNITIELDGDTADVTSNVISWTWTVEKSVDGDPMRGADYALSVRYFDRMSRHSEGWRIDSRRLVANTSKTGQAMVVAVGELPASQRGVNALAKRQPPTPAD